MREKPKYNFPPFFLNSSGWINNQTKMRHTHQREKMSRFYDGCDTELPLEREAGGCVGSWGLCHSGLVGVGPGSGTSEEKQVTHRQPRKSRCTINSCWDTVEPRSESSKRALPSCVYTVTLSDTTSCKQVSHLDSFRQVRGRVQGSS